LFPYLAGSQNTIIQGKSPDYAGKIISFYTYSEPVVHQKQELASTRAEADGTFILSFSLKQTQEIYTDLEKFTGTLVAERGKNYTVTLPPFSPKSQIESKSPYFEPTLYWLGLPKEDQRDLNFKIRSFITDYNNEILKNTPATSRNLSKEKVSEIIGQLENKYGSDKTEYFLALRKYNYAELENTADPGNPEPIIEKYFKKEAVRLTHPSYQAAFQLIFNDFLRKQSMDYRKKNISLLVNSGDFQGLVSYFEKSGYHKEVADVVVLKGLYDGYYTGGFNKEKIIKAIDEALNLISPELKPTVNLVKSKLVKLNIKGKAPFFQLNNLKNETTTLEKYRGKFVYLNFFRSNSKECREELDSLKSLERKFRPVLNVVSISLDENFQASAKLWKEKGYMWDLLNGSGKKLLIENYNAEVVPVFYLLDAEGKLILSPSPPPSHEFEPMFLKIFRDYRFRK
jgi:peroxiredoxin